MFTVQLVFDSDMPDSEDQGVLDYISEHELEPKYHWDEEFKGRQCHWMQFGGCYLGNHLQGIGQIQRSAVEVELLAAEIADHLNSVDPDGPLIDGSQREVVVATLVKEFKRDSSFQTDANGELIAVLDKMEVREAVQRLLSG